MEKPSSTVSWFDRPVAPGFALRREQALWLLLILAAVASRFILLEPRVISHDEGQHVQLAWSLYRGSGYTPNPMTHGPFQIIVVALSYFVFGAGDASSRLPAAAFGVAAVALLYFFRRWLGRGGALAAGALMLISPYMLYYSRYVRNESFVVVWGLLMLYAIGRYLESRQARWLYLLAAVTALHYATKETAYIYVGLAIIFLFGLIQVQLSLRRWAVAERRTWFVFLSIMAVLVLLGGVALIAAGHSQLVDQALTAGATLDPEEMLHTEMWITNPLVVIGAALSLLAVAGFSAAAGILLREFPLPSLREEFPAVDLLVVLGTTLLPQLAAFPMALVNLNPFDPFYGGPLERITDANFLLSSMVCLVIVAAPAIVIGLLWDRKRWLAYAGIFFGVYGLLFSVCLTNFSGVMVGLVGSVNYWMAQQGIARGRQPWYYYILLQIPIYEFLPALLALSAPAAAFLLRRKNPSAAPEGEVRDASAPSSPPAESVWRNIAASPALWMFGYFCVASMAAFTAAGEKMPWLTVHITLPFILIGGWVVGAVAGRTDWARLGRWPSWTGWLMLPAALALALSAVVKLLGTSRPFAGNTEAQLNATADFVSLVFGTAVLIFLLTLLWRGIQRAEVFRVVFLSATLILAVCTLRTAWRAGYIEYDNATEFLVYAHAAGGVKTAVTQIEEISQKTQDDLDIPVPYDIRSGWLLNWYLREYPNRVNYGETLERSFIDEPVVVVGDFYWDQADRLLSDTHYAFTYMRMWWPMMDYFDLTPDRVWNAVSSPTYRSALWQIWFNRDYAEYAALTGEDLSLSNWPSGERMRLYVRKDLAAQVWQYGSTAFVPPVEADPYAGAVRTLEAAELWGQAGTEPGMLQRPRGIAAAPDGSVYVADTFNHRIQHFDGHGNLLQTWGSYSGGDAAAAADGTFNEPWGVAVGPDGSVYVADTWNYRVQKFTADGGFLAVWGSFTNADDGYQLYGPRAIAVDDEGRVFVADTGNKRITMYDSDGNFLQTIGRPGYDTGQLDEPVGLAVTPGGRLYVADTWNRRIQVFQDYGGNFAYLTEWPIEGWEGESTDTKPYLAVSPDGRLWVTDPGNARILVFDLEGNFLFTFGAFGADAASFALPTGIAVSPDGRIYVTDTDNNRIMVFNAP